jgi:hypothetical protein
MKYLSILTVALMVLLVGTAKKVYIPNGVVRSEPTELEKFLDHMAQRESDNTPHVVNRFGMMGKYQFDPRTIKVLGFNISKNQFLRNPELQDSVMVKYMRENNSLLDRIIENYEGKKFKGIRITRSGVLAAAHLAGAGNVKKYFSNGDMHGRTDANGTSIRDYLEEFNKYKLRENF